MNILIIGYLLAGITGVLYSHALRPMRANVPIPHPALIAGMALIRIVCMGLFLYCLLNSLPIHSILMVVIFGTIVWIKR